MHLGTELLEAVNDVEQRQAPGVGGNSIAISSGMKRPAIIPRLRNNDRTRRFSGGIIVRTVRTTARRNPSHIACSSRAPTPDSRCIAAAADPFRDGFAEELSATRLLYEHAETRRKVAEFLTKSTP